MAKCEHCPLSVALGALNDYSDGFEAEAVKDAGSVGNLSQVRNRACKKLFEGVVSRIDCQYDPYGEHVEPVPLDDTEGEGEVVDVDEVAQPSLEDVLASLGTNVDPGKVQACIEPFQIAMNLSQFQTQSGAVMADPSGYPQSEESRRANKQSQDNKPDNNTGQYL